MQKAMGGSELKRVYMCVCVCVCVYTHIYIKKIEHVLIFLFNIIISLYR